MKRVAFSRSAGALALCLQANPVLAEEAGSKGPSVQLAAEVLFLDGMKLMKAGRCAEAIGKFRNSQELDPASGTLLNLAYCQLTLDLVASAWLTYRQALALAQASQKAQHAQIAREQADKLEPVLPRLVIRSANAQARELIVELDGASLAPSVWSVPVPVDPGDHRLSAKLEDGEVWQTQFGIARAQRVAVEIPLPLVPVAAPKAPVASEPQSTAHSSPPTPDVAGPTLDTTLKTPSPARVPASDSRMLVPPSKPESPRGPLWAFGVAMVGAGALTAGAALFVSARVSYDSAKSHCGPDNACPDPYYDAEHDAIGRMRLSVVLAGAGVVAGGLGGWLYWMPPRKALSSRASVSSFIGPGTVGIRGAW